jgi:hypothetical protein
MPVEEIDGDFAILATQCSDSEPAEEDQLERALHDARSQAKDQERRQTGLIRASLVSVLPQLKTHPLKGMLWIFEPGRLAHNPNPALDRLRNRDRRLSLNPLAQVDILAVGPDHVSRADPSP